MANFRVCPKKVEENVIEEDEPDQEDYDRPTEVCYMPSSKRFMGEFDRQSMASITARLPKELFYQYNPSCVDKPSSRVLPLLFRQWRDEETMDLYSLERNQDLAKNWKHFVKALPLSDQPLMQIPSSKSREISEHNLTKNSRPSIRKWYNNLMETGCVDVKHHTSRPSDDTTMCTSDADVKLLRVAFQRSPASRFEGPHRNCKSLIRQCTAYSENVFSYSHNRLQLLQELNLMIDRNARHLLKTFLHVWTRKFSHSTLQYSSDGTNGNIKKTEKSSILKKLK